MSLKKILYSKTLQNTTTLTNITIYCEKELDITITKLKQTKDTDKLKVNLRRIVQLWVDRSEEKLENILDYFGHEYLDYCNMVIPIKADKVYNVGKDISWKELSYLIQKRSKDPEKLTRTVRNVTSLKQVFGGELVYD